MYDTKKVVKNILGDRTSRNNMKDGCSVCGGPCKPQKDCPEIQVCVDKECSVHRDEW